MGKWYYKVLTIPAASDEGWIESMLNRVGDEGWELVTIKFSLWPAADDRGLEEA